MQDSRRIVRPVPQMVEQVSDDVAFGLSHKTLEDWIRAKAVAKLGLGVKAR